MPTSRQTDVERERAQQQWQRMERSDRRRVLKSVNRMQAMEDPTEARVAVWLAERQRRIWVRWWWVFPLLGGLTAAPRGWIAVAVNIAIGLVFIAALAAAYAWRAGRSAAINQAVVDEGRKGRRATPPRNDASAPKGRPTRKRSSYRRKH